MLSLYKSVQIWHRKAREAQAEGGRFYLITRSINQTRDGFVHIDHSEAFEICVSSVLKYQGQLLYNIWHSTLKSTLKSPICVLICVSGDNNICTEQ